MLSNRFLFLLENQMQCFEWIVKPFILGDSLTTQYKVLVMDEKVRRIVKIKGRDKVNRVMENKG